jgi:hypothetical protein
MKEVSLADFDKLMFRKRAIVELVIDQLKNISQIEHTIHRSIIGVREFFEHKTD